VVREEDGGRRLVADDGTPPPTATASATADDAIVFSSPSFVVGVIFLFIVLHASMDIMHEYSNTKRESGELNYRSTYIASPNIWRTLSHSTHPVVSRTPIGHDVIRYASSPNLP
jgi:hypothetical protein